MNSMFPEFGFFSEPDATEASASVASATSGWFDSDFSIFHDELPPELESHILIHNASESIHDAGAPMQPTAAHTDPLLVDVNPQVWENHENVFFDIVDDDILELGMEISKQVANLDIPPASNEEASQQPSPEGSWVTHTTREKGMNRKKRPRARCPRKNKPGKKRSRQRDAQLVDEETLSLSRIVSMTDDEPETHELNHGDECNMGAEEDENLLWADDSKETVAAVMNLSPEEQQRQLDILRQKLKTRAPTLKRLRNRNMLSTEAVQSEIGRMLDQSKQLLQQVRGLLDERTHATLENHMLTEHYTQLKNGCH